MKSLRLIAALTLFLAVFSSPSGLRATQRQSDLRALRQAEQRLLAAIEQHDLAMLGQLLADDFTYQDERATIDKGEFIAQLEKLSPLKMKIKLIGNRVRCYGNAAISTGSARLVSESDAPIAGQPGTASQSAVVNLGTVPAAPGPTPPRGVPSPMLSPEDRALPTVGVTYRYTATYIKLNGRWRVAALQSALSTR